MKVDAHHHFWKYNTEEYGWIDDRMSKLRRNFIPEDLEMETRAAGIGGVLSVEARQTIEETRWLLQLADRYNFVKGVVGWVPLTSPEVIPVLDELASNKWLKGVRHVLQDEPDDYFILRDDFNRGVGALERHELVYDILVFERHLPQTIEFVRRHHEQVFVLDHMGKPRIREGLLSPWRENVRQLAECENVFCKLSGMVTEAKWEDWTEEDLKPHYETVLEAFTPARLMFGSDWPVCLVACDYQRWYHVLSQFVSTLSSDEQKRIFGGTAIQVYKL